jgi:HAMP domain-containing protein
LTLQTAVVVAALLLAVLGLLRARRVSKRIDRLSESYWELRYESGQLRSRMDRLEGAAEPSESPVEAPDSSFVPLSSLKR